jgi:hypothetical protein
MTQTTATNALDALAADHPHHAMRITAHNAAMDVGAVVKVDGNTETGTFYTGIRPGDHVVVTEWVLRGSYEARSVQVPDGNAASLAASHLTLTAVDPLEWTLAEAQGAKRAAERAAHDLMERALTQATGYNSYGAVDEDRALGSLRQAAELRRYAFAVGVLLSRLDPASLDHYGR